MTTQTTTLQQPKFYEKFGFVSLITFFVACALLQLHHVLHDVTLPWLQKLSSPDASYVALVEFISFISKESGFAVLVAFFLNLSVELINRRRHAEQESSLVNLLDAKHQKRMDELLIELAKNYDERTTKLLKDVFQTVYERYIEKGVFRVIDDHVLKKDLMRKKYKVSMTITPLENVENLVNLSLYISYDVVNLTTRQLTVPLCGAMIDVTPEHENKCKFVRAKIGDKVYEEAELAGMVVRDDENAQWSLKIEGSINGGATLPVELEYKKVGPRDYAEAICTTVQMDSMEIDVLLTDDTLRVNAVALHPEDEVCTSPAGRAMFTSWKIEHAILPGQGAIIFWHPKRGRLAAPVVEGEAVAA